MSRFASFVLGMVALMGSLFAVSVVAQAGVKMGDAPGPCSYVPLAFSLNGSVPVETTRPFAPAAGERYLQFAPGLPITTTGSSTGALLLYNTFGGTASGGITGTFVISNLNGIAITGSTTSPEGRGFLVNNVVVTDATGSMNLVLAVNFAATTAAAPYYPRNINGYVQAVSTTGGYAPYRFSGTVTGSMGPPSGGMVAVSFGIQGKLYTGFAAPSTTMSFAGSRELPPTRPVALVPTDILAQFTDDDMQAGSTNGNFNATSVFTGETNFSLTSTFELETHSMLVGDSYTFSPGWLVGNFRGRTEAGDTYYGPWVTDLPGVSMDGYFFQTSGTGVYANSLMFGEQSGAIAYKGGEDIAGGLWGYFCTDMVGPQVTVTPTVPPTATVPATFTATPIPTNTRTNTPTATSTSTSTSTLAPTQTPGGATATPEPTQTNTLVPTATVPPVETETPTLVPTMPPATATATVCTLQFQDVPEGSTFYAPVMCLACRGIVGGYPCGGVGEPCGGSGDPYFRPGNSVTRGQVAKIVAQAAGYGEPVSGQAFEDVAPGSTFYEYVQRMAVRGIMSGYACGGVVEPCVSPGDRPYFRPNAVTSRGQLAKIVCGAAGCKGPVSDQAFEDVLPGSTFFDVIEMLMKWGVFSGYACGGVGEPCVPPENRPYFRPGNIVTRGQTSKIVGNTLLAGCEVR